MGGAMMRAAISVEKIMRGKAGGGQIGRLEEERDGVSNFEVQANQKTCFAVIRAFSGIKLAVLSLVNNADCLPTAGVP
jgi:hypothetical protein